MTITLAGHRILVAEDEGMIALQIEDLLTDLGCEVVGPFSRVSEVTKCIQAETLDGALLDVNLRGESILSILPRFTELRIPFIITSGYDAESLFPSEFRSLNRLTKPFDENELRRLCEKTFSSL